ncbi:hypothetical protein RYX36_025627 [Vicia faba]
MKLSKTTITNLSPSLTLHKLSPIHTTQKQQQNIPSTIHTLLLSPLFSSLSFSLLSNLNIKYYITFLPTLSFFFTTKIETQITLHFIFKFQFLHIVTKLELNFHFFFNSDSARN